ncbi:hypothetical protein [Dysgonomonas sp. HGC4]|uniref:hypothetical protein n=1 Tax=Dysgonomonas sp. HGC4 TaxID=1658009 RepID=UPI0006827BFD|nr:hypothetical protein [Dysgonomonas sp. HGC4]MBD8349358.1 hypothetical protein [Dysgonomonas sp. HGC4]
MSQNKSILKDLSLYPLQAYLTDDVQLFDVVRDVLRQIGAADIFITSFSISEEFIRSMFRQKSNSQILSAKLLIDMKAAMKIAKLIPFASNVFDEIYLSNNHSKVLLLSNEKYKVSINTSQNQTRGNRNESGIITTDQAIYQLYENAINEIVKKSINAKQLLTRDT